MNRGLLAKITSPVHELGLFAGMVYMIDRLLLMLSPSLRLHHYEFMVQPIPLEPLMKGKFANSVQMREIREDSPEIAKMPVRKDILALRFRQGAICLGAYQNDKWIGFIWLSFGSYEEDEVRCTFVLGDPGESVFDFNLYIFPEYRMGLGFVGIWNGTNRYLRERGVKYTFSRLTRHNIGSRRSHAHLGWKRVGQGLFLQLWQFEFMLINLFPYVGCNIRKSSRTVIQLSPIEHLA